MNVGVVVESFDQLLVFREVGEDSQFDLRIVCRQKYPVGFAGYESPSYRSSGFGPDGDVLQIRIFRAQATGRGDVLHE